MTPDAVSAEIDADTLLERGVSPRLTSLRVVGLDRPDALATLERLLAAPWLARLRGLDIHGAGLSWESDSEWNPFGFEGVGDGVARLLAASGLVAGLRSLGISHSRLGPDGARALTKADGIDGVERLWLRGQGVGDDAAMELLGRLPRLSSLDLTSANDSKLLRLTGRVATHLRPTVTELRLGWNDFRDADVIALTESPLAAGLRHLALGYASLGVAGLRALARFPSLETLDLSGAGVGPAGYPDLEAKAVRALAETPLPRMRDLSLAGCSLDEAAVRALAGAFGPQLDRLDLRYVWHADRIADELRKVVRGEVLLGKGEDAAELMPG